MMLPANRRVENAWMTLEQRGAPPAELLSADIYDSWMRCISLGLDTLRPPAPEFVSPAILRQEQQRCSLVRGLALAEMHTLHQQIAGSNFMIAFASADGLLLDKYPTRASATLRTQRAFGQVYLDGRYLRDQRPWDRCAPQTSDRRAWARALFFAVQQSNLRCSTDLCADGELTGYSMLRRIACPGRLTPRRSSPWRRPRSRMACSANTIAEIS